MKTIITLFVVLLLLNNTNAQTTAMQFKGLDCNGKPVDLFADLDSGKAVMLHFYMANCGSCPPSAKKIQATTNRINKLFPGMVKGYAFPYENVTTCAYSASWVSSSGLSELYTPMDSGATQVAYYGGFGMPSIVLLGGKDHKVKFFTMSFATSDTTVIRDSIYSILKTATAIDETSKSLASFNVYPTIITDNLNINVTLKNSSSIRLEVLDVLGNTIKTFINDKNTVRINTQFDCSFLPNGNYFVKLTSNEQSITKRIIVNH